MICSIETYDLTSDQVSTTELEIGDSVSAVDKQKNEKLLDEELSENKDHFQFVNKTNQPVIRIAPTAQRRAKHYQVIELSNERREDMSRQRDKKNTDYDFEGAPYQTYSPSDWRITRISDYEGSCDDKRRSGALDREIDEHGRVLQHSPPQVLSKRYGGERFDYNWKQKAPKTIHPQSMKKKQGALMLQKKKKATKRKIFLFGYNLLFYMLTIGILLSSLMVVFSEKSDAAIFGYRFYHVLTDSMAPQSDGPLRGFYSGDIVIVRLGDGSQVRKGEIVTFKVGDDNRYLTHRVVERLDELNGEKGNYIVTKGDANNSKDPPISTDRVCGKVIFIIPKMGSILSFVQENLWLCLVCVISTFGFFLVLKAYFLQPE